MDGQDREQALRRTAALREELAAATRRTAEVAEHSARVHDELADTHERLPAALLDPDQLRRHAAADREFAAEERRRADELGRG